ncbi:MAG: hypothetical protein AAFQ85_02085 [Pseudomonadota bacterium]
MASERPDIAGAHTAWGVNGHYVIRRIAWLLWHGRSQRGVDLSHRKAGDTDVEGQIIDLQDGAELLGEEVLVPTGVQRELVVGEDVGPFSAALRCLIRRQGTL